MKKQQPTKWKLEYASRRSLDATRQVVSMANRPARVVELGEQGFAAAVDGHPFAVVEFWSSACAASRAFAPTFAAAAAKAPAALFATVDCEAERALCAQFNIRSTPTLVILRGNIIVYANAGALAPAALEEVLAAARALDMEEAQRHVDSVDAITLNAHATSTAESEVQGAADTDPLSIETHLSPWLRGPESALAGIAPRLAAGELVAIPNAFDPVFAEQMHRGLDGCSSWRLYESFEEHFHYHHHSLYQPDEFPSELTRCAEILDSPGTKAWVTQLSGRLCDAPIEIGASWYLPGDHSLPHNDVANTGPNINRQVAFVWHLAKDWRSEWGGSLYWCPRAAYLPPAFNTLYIFNVGPESAHFVTTVSPYARGKRLAINGWWTGPAAAGNPVWKGPTTSGPAGARITIY